MQRLAAGLAWFGAFALFALAFTASATWHFWPNALTRWQLRNRRHIGVAFALGGAGGAALKTNQDSVSYGIGLDIGQSLKGQGAPGIGGGANGDLYLTIRFAPHPKFDVEGQDLIITLPLAPWELALGTEVAVPTLTGKINLKVPAGSHCPVGWAVPSITTRPFSRM
mgnify:CR=1 FL=1